MRLEERAADAHAHAHARKSEDGQEIVTRHRGPSET